MKGLRMTEEELQEFLRRGQRAADEAATQVRRHVDHQVIRSVYAESKLEARFTQQLRRTDLPAWERNYFAIPERDFEVDFAWPNFAFGVEIDGGAHQASGRARRDYEKHLLLVLHGWTVLRLDGALVRSGRGIELVLEIMRARGVL